MLKKQPNKNPTSIRSTGCTLVCSRLICDLEDGGDTFLRNVGSYMYYMELCTKRHIHLIDTAHLHDVADFEAKMKYKP
jgi:hypothetical protein